MSDERRIGLWLAGLVSVLVVSALIASVSPGAASALAGLVAVAICGLWELAGHCAEDLADSLVP